MSGSNDKTIRVWDINTGAALCVFEGHKDLVRTLCFDQERIVSGSYDQSIKVWDIKSGKLIFDLTDAHSSWVCHVGMDPSKIVSAR